MSEIRGRNTNDILIAVVDASSEERKPVVAALRPIYRASNAAAAVALKIIYINERHRVPERFGAQGDPQQRVFPLRSSGEPAHRLALRNISEKWKSLPIS